MVDGPLVSAIMPMRNVRRYVAEAIESILAQTYRNWELVMLDDASTDGTAEIAAKYVCDRVRLIRSEQVGASQSRNTAVREAKGEYLALMDADDVSLPTRFAEEMQELLAHEPAGAVSCWVVRISVNGRELYRARNPIDSSVIRRDLFRANCFAHPCAVMRRSAFEDVGAYRLGLSMSEDYDLWLRMSECHELRTIPSFLYLWRLRPGELVGQSPLKTEAGNQLIRDWATQRRATGVDPMAGGSAEEVAAAVEAKYRQLRSEKGDPWSPGRHCAGRTLEHLSVGDRRGALLFALHGIRAEPMNPLSWCALATVALGRTVARLIQWSRARRRGQRRTDARPSQRGAGS
jgi:hypothetical protein